MKKMAVVTALAACFTGAGTPTGALAQTQAPVFTRADTLRGSNGPARAWWDVSFYDLAVTINPADSTIRGSNGIAYRVVRPARVMQIDLQVPMQVDSMVQDGKRVTYRRDGNAFFATLTSPQTAGALKRITVYYSGKPVSAKNPPWDGGYIWRRDSLGNRWVATANEGLGASVWWPNKDHLSDEPDSQRIAVTVPDPMVNVSNGRLRSTKSNGNGTTTYEWFVASPINNYNISVNAGNYAHFSDTYKGEAGNLTLDYWPLQNHLDTAKVQWQQVRPMMECFEKWFGPYPWYKDGYKLVEAPHLGMEHQSAVAYGNGFINGYRGRDLSGTGWGLKWDFITVHESAHEWWGNNITMKDQADMWIHESFANYAEGIYAECRDGKKAGAEYIIGSRRNIRNDVPVIPAYGVNAEGSGDMYYKGGSMIHILRRLVDNDEKWRGILRGLNKTFWHRTVTGAQVRAYINSQAGMDFSKIFQQYQETTKIPVLEYSITGGNLRYRWTNVVKGFDMPVDVALGGSSSAGGARGTGATYTRIRPTAAWKLLPVKLASGDTISVDPDFYVTLKAVK